MTPVKRKTAPEASLLPETVEALAPAGKSNVHALLGLLAGMGAVPALTEALAEMAGEQPDADTRHWLHGPLVVHQSAWNDTLPDWMPRQARAERFAIVAGEMPGHVVGPTEIACVMYGAMMDAPRGTELSNLYLWAAGHAARSHFGGKVEAAVAETTEGLSDEQFVSRAGRYSWTYSQFAREIRRKVAEAHREAERGERREAKALAKVGEMRRAQAERETAPEAPPRVLPAQFDLFGGEN